MSARQGWWTFVAAGVTAASLASCSGQSDPPQSTTATSTATAAAATTPSPTPDALAACALIGDGEDDSIIERIPASLTSIESTITQEQIDELLDINATLDEAIEVAPTDLAAALTSLKVPFQQAQDVVDAGSGSRHMDTASVAADVTEVLSLCVDAGYTLATTEDTTDAGGSLAADVEAAVAQWPSVTTVTETEPGRVDISTTITDPRGDNDSPEAQEALAICQAAVNAGATYVALYEADGTHFALYGHPLVPAGECGEI